jgi:hypothetical protein
MKGNEWDQSTPTPQESLCWLSSSIIHQTILVNLSTLDGLPFRDEYKCNMSHINIASVQVVNKMKIVLLDPTIDPELCFERLFEGRCSMEAHTGRHNTEECGHVSMPRTAFKATFSGVWRVHTALSLEASWRKQPSSCSISAHSPERGRDAWQSCLPLFPNRWA